MTEEQVKSQETQEERKKSDEEILFPDQEIAGIIIRPWSFGTLFKIAQPLERILDKLERAGLAERLIDKDGLLQLDYLILARLFTIASQELLTVISLTLNVDKETVEELSIEDGIRIVLAMFFQNRDLVVNSLKNALSPPQTTLEKKVKEKAERGPKKKKKKN